MACFVHPTLAMVAGAWLGWVGLAGKEYASIIGALLGVGVALAMGLRRGRRERFAQLVSGQRFH